MFTEIFFGGVVNKAVIVSTGSGESAERGEGKKSKYVHERPRLVVTAVGALRNSETW